MTVSRHVYDGERCTFCGVNVNDQAIYGATPCIDREPITYTTETL